MRSSSYGAILISHLPSCSFFWLFIKAVMHACLLTPIPDTTLQQPPMEPQPFLPILLFNFGINFILHMSYPSPSAGEETRGYLHGGLMIDFIGQQGPTSKWKLAGMDILVLVLQLIMVSVHVKRRELKKKLAKFSTGSTGNEENAGTATTEDAGVTETNAADETMAENAARGQEADDEERGVLHRSDTLSDIGANPDEEEHALLSASDGSRPDALELLTSGQCVIGEFTLIDTLIQEYKNYAEHRSTQTEGSTGAATETLRRLHTLRTNFGVAGG